MTRPRESVLSTPAIMVAWAVCLALPSHTLEITMRGGGPALSVYDFLPMLLFTMCYWRFRTPRRGELATGKGRRTRVTSARAPT